jgi:type I restriction enzyme S subunit
LKLPKEWRRLPLHAVADVRTGLAKGKTGISDAVRLPYLRVANVQDGHLDLSEIKQIDVARDQVQRYSLQPGDILMTEGGDFDKLGRGAVWRGQFEPCLHQNHVFAVRPDTEQIEPAYLAALAASDYGRAYFITCAKRSTNLASINSSQLKAFPVPLPPIAEQRKIAGVLDCWAQAVVTTKCLLANRYELWHALLAKTLHLPPPNQIPSEWADNGGFPISVQPGIPNLPPTPHGWSRTSLGEHLTEVRRPALLDAIDVYRLVTVKRSRGGVGLRALLPGSEIKTPSQFYVHSGDFLISKRQIVHGACGLVPPELDGAIVSNEYAVLNSKGQLDLRFLRYLSESRYFQQTCFHSSIGVHVEKMIFKTDHWLKWPFNIPPLHVQQHIVEILDTARQEVDLIAEQIEKLKQEKAALMADLLTGKRRVRIGQSGATAP